MMSTYISQKEERDLKKVSATQYFPQSRACHHRLHQKGAVKPAVVSEYIKTRFSVREMPSEE